MTAAPGALEAFRHADQRGHAGGASSLGLLLERRGELARALAAYRRADERGDGDGAFNLGALLADDGDLAGARAAYLRASQRADAETAQKARTQLVRLDYPTQSLRGLSVSRTSGDHAS